MRRKKSRSPYCGKQAAQAEWLSFSHRRNVLVFIIWPWWWQMARYSWRLSTIFARGQPRRIALNISTPNRTKWCVCTMSGLSSATSSSMTFGNCGSGLANLK